YPDLVACGPKGETIPLRRVRADFYLFDETAAYVKNNMSARTSPKAGASGGIFTNLLADLQVICRPKNCKGMRYDHQKLACQRTSPGKAAGDGFRVPVRRRAACHLPAHRLSRSVGGRSGPAITKGFRGAARHTGGRPAGILSWPGPGSGQI